MSDDHIPGRQAELLKRLLGPPGPELSCDECFELLDEYVERELAAGQAIPGMRAHLEGCAACSEEHSSLLALVQSAIT